MTLPTTPEACAEQARRFHEDGFVLLPGSVAAPAGGDVDVLSKALCAVWGEYTRTLILALAGCSGTDFQLQGGKKNLSSYGW